MREMSCLLMFLCAMSMLKYANVDASWNSKTRHPSVSSHNHSTEALGIGMTFARAFFSSIRRSTVAFGLGVTFARGHTRTYTPTHITAHTSTHKHTRHQHLVQSYSSVRRPFSICSSTHPPIQHHEPPKYTRDTVAIARFERAEWR